jgi:SepF-like predicted cell division protein (DUF552 family)
MGRLMVEPVLTAAAIATMMATKAFEKTGEKIGEAVVGSISKFLGALRRKDPKTADAIATVAQQPQLAEQQPQDYGTAVLVAKVEEAAKDDVSLKQVIEELATTAKAQHPIINNVAKLQEKGIIVQGGYADFREATINF